jgi:hypothetical protein
VGQNDVRYFNNRLNEVELTSWDKTMSDTSIIDFNEVELTSWDKTMSDNPLIDFTEVELTS